MRHARRGCCIATSLALILSLLPTPAYALRKAQDEANTSGLEEALRAAGRQVVAFLSAPPASLPASAAARFESSHKTGLEEDEQSLPPMAVVPDPPSRDSRLPSVKDGFDVLTRLLAKGPRRVNAWQDRSFSGLWPSPSVRLNKGVVEFKAQGQWKPFAPDQFASVGVNPNGELFFDNEPNTHLPVVSPEALLAAPVGPEEDRLAAVVTPLPHPIKGTEIEDNVTMLFWRAKPGSYIAWMIGAMGRYSYSKVLAADESAQRLHLQEVTSQREPMGAPGWFTASEVLRRRPRLIESAPSPSTNAPATGLEEGVALPLDEASRTLETYRRAEGVNAVQVGPSGPVRRLFTQTDNTLIPISAAERTRLLQDVAVQNRVVLQYRRDAPLLVRAPTEAELQKAVVATGPSTESLGTGLEENDQATAHAAAAAVAQLESVTRAWGEARVALPATVPPDDLPSILVFKSVPETDLDLLHYVPVAVMAGVPVLVIAPASSIPQSSLSVKGQALRTLLNTLPAPKAEYFVVATPREAAEILTAYDRRKVKEVDGVFDLQQLFGIPIDKEFPSPVGDAAARTQAYFKAQQAGLESGA